MWEHVGGGPSLPECPCQNPASLLLPFTHRSPSGAIVPPHSWHRRWRAKAAPAGRGGGLGRECSAPELTGWGSRALGQALSSSTGNPRPCHCSWRSWPALRAAGRFQCPGDLQGWIQDQLQRVSILCPGHRELGQSTVSPVLPPLLPQDSPGGPAGPLSPGCPFSPFGPGGPGRPVGPTGPGGPTCPGSPEKIKEGNELEARTLLRSAAFSSLESRKGTQGWRGENGALHRQGGAGGSSWLGCGAQEPHWTLCPSPSSL